MKNTPAPFCMSQFKWAIGILVILVTVVLGWSVWTCKPTRAQRHSLGLTVAAAAGPAPPAGNIRVQTKMNHPYWGNCNKCHITIDVPTKPVSQVFAGPPISVNDPMLHEYWGNCNLCHKVVDGFQPPQPNNAQPNNVRAAAAAAPAGAPPIAPGAVANHPDWGPCNNCHQITPNGLTGKANNAQVAAAQAPAGTPPIAPGAVPNHPDWGPCTNCHQITPNGLTGKANNAQVAAAQAPTAPPIAPGVVSPHADWGPCNNCHQILQNNAGPTPQPQTVAAVNQITAETLGLKLQTVTGAQMQQLGLANEDGVLVLEVRPNSLADQAGIQVGDELIRVGNVRLDTVNDFNAAIIAAKPGTHIKVNLYRGVKQRNVFLNIPEELPKAVKAAAFMTPLAALNPTPMFAPAAPNNEFELQPQQNPGMQQPMFGGQQPMGAPGMNQELELVPAPTTPGQNPQIGQPNQVWQAQGQQQMNMIPAQAPVGPGTPQATQVDPAPQMQQQMTTGPARQVVVPNNGKVAFASMGPDIYSQVAQQFGSNPYFIVYDPIRNAYQSIVNPNYNDLTGRDQQSAQYALDIGAQNMVAGSFTAEGFNSLQSLHINAYSGFSGSVADGVAMYKTGQMQPSIVNPI